jgi:hypothetical protein
MIVAKYGNYVRKFMWQRVGRQGKGDISLTVHRRAILKVVKSMCNGIKKIKCTLMKCHTNINSTPFTQLPHKFSYIVAILGHNHFASPNIRGPILVLIPYFPTKIMMITMFNEWYKVAPLSFKSYFATHVAKNVTVIETFSWHLYDFFKSLWWYVFISKCLMSEQ